MWVGKGTKQIRAGRGTPSIYNKLDLEEPLHLSKAPHFLLYLALKGSQPDHTCFLSIFSDNLLLFPFFQALSFRGACGAQKCIRIRKVGLLRHRCAGPKVLTC